MSPQAVTAVVRVIMIVSRVMSRISIVQYWIRNHRFGIAQIDRNPLGARRAEGTKAAQLLPTEGSCDVR